MSAGSAYESGVVKSAGANISEKEIAHAKEASFGELFETVEKETGLPGDEVLYKDPFGWRTPGPSRENSLYYPQDMFEGPSESADGWQEAFKEFNQLQREGMELREAAKQVAKAVDRTSYSLPIFVSPDVYRGDGKDTPLADSIPRVAVQNDTIQADEEIDSGTISAFAEGGTYPMGDGNVINHSYSIYSYGRESEVTDFVQLAASSLRSTRSFTEDQMMRSMRKYEENQFFQGNGATTGNDPNGFPGLADLVEDGTGPTGLDMTTDAAGAAVTTDMIYDNINRLTSAGASRDRIATFLPHDLYSSLLKTLNEYTRYDSPGDNLSFGFQTLDISGTPVFVSHGVAGGEMWTLDMSSIYAGMLQDTTLHPLAKTGPTETFAVDTYGALVAEGVSHITQTTNVTA